jgi:drug/metabolite transporter (DMT)-like permease
MLLVLGVSAALAAAAFYSCGVTLQAIEARDVPADQSLKLSLLLRLVRRRRWLYGTTCVIGGWVMQALALLLAPITVVQPALALSVVGLLFIAVRFFDESVGAREVAAALAIVLGVAGLALLSPHQSDSHARPVTLAVGMTALALVAIAPYALVASGRRIGILIVFSAGLAYAWTGFSTKFLADGVSSGAWPVGLIWLAATVGAAGVGLLSEMTALQTQPAIRVFPVVIVVQIVVAVMLAPLLASEASSPTPMRVAAVVASLAVLAVGTRSLASARAVGRVVATE